MNRIYPSKILWFGEHSVIKGSNALAIPYSPFFGQWKWYAPYQLEALDSSKLADLSGYLMEQQYTNSYFPSLDGFRFQEDIAEGLYFESNIPQGYGLGSSGALCAAIYDQYADHFFRPSLRELKHQLGLMECYFHGSSSGTDPLVCLLNQSLLIEPHYGITPLEVVFSPRDDIHFFLLDTGIQRKTAPWVNKFLEYCEDTFYQSQIDEQLIPLTNQAIDTLLVGDYDELFEVWAQISYFQFQYFNAFIPDGFHEIWLEGLGGDEFRLKLCGAGGGGFLLGMSKVPLEWIQIKFPLAKFHRIS